jgi:hypothetical protein
MGKGLFTPPSPSTSLSSLAQLRVVMQRSLTPNLGLQFAMDLLYRLSSVLLPHTPQSLSEARLTPAVCAASIRVPDPTHGNRHRLDHLTPRLGLRLSSDQPLGCVGYVTSFSDFLLELDVHRPLHSMTVEMVVDDRCNRRVVSELVRSVLGYDSLCL